MLKYENQFQIGDLIRAYDFEPFGGRDPIFVEGLVTQVLSPENDVTGFGCYVIKATLDTLGKRVNKSVYVPMESTFDFDGRVVKV